MVCLIPVSRILERSSAPSLTLWATLRRLGALGPSWSSGIRRMSVATVGAADPAGSVFSEGRALSCGTRMRLSISFQTCTPASLSLALSFIPIRYRYENAGILGRQDKPPNEPSFGDTYGKGNIEDLARPMARTLNGSAARSGSIIHDC